MTSSIFKKLLNETNEFERTPVPASDLKSGNSFLGMYSGEHTAGTEFVIGLIFRLVYAHCCLK